MAHFSCSETQIKYTANGTQVLFTFPFEYMVDTDIWVGLWNEFSRRYEVVTYWPDVNIQPTTIAPYYWTLDNATTIRFLQVDIDPDAPASPVPPPTDWAPPGSPWPVTTPGTPAHDAARTVNPDNLLIQRKTDIDPLIAMFYPGASIRAQDLNDNFEQLKLAIEDGRCVIPQWFYSWIDSNLKRITEEQNQAGDWQYEGTLDDNDHFATAAALTDRFQPFWQATTPEAGNLPDWRMPGKIWVDRANTVAKFWNQDQQVWEVFAGDGTPGQRGPAGPPGSFQIGDVPPLSVPIPDAVPPDPTSRALQSGDAWFNTDTGNLFVWYVDSNSGQWVNCSQAGPAGPAGERQRVFIGDNPPLTIDGEAVQAGDMWFNSDTADLFVFYTDNDSDQWVNLSNTPGPQGPPGPPGQNGGGNADFARLTAVAPIQIALSNANQDAEISFDLNLLNGLG
jgi:hypothetical protein